MHSIKMSFKKDSRTLAILKNSILQEASKSIFQNINKCYICVQELYEILLKGFYIYKILGWGVLLLITKAFLM